MEKFMSCHHSQSFSIKIVQFSISLLRVVHILHQWSKEERSFTILKSFFSINFSDSVEIRIPRNPVYRGAANKSASIAWSGSKLTSWFVHLGKLDGNSVSPYPRMPATGRVVDGKWAASKADRSTAFVW